MLTEANATQLIYEILGGGIQLKILAVDLSPDKQM